MIRSNGAFGGPALAALDYDARFALTDAVQAVADGAPARAQLALSTLSDAELERAIGTLARTLGVLGAIREGRRR